MPVTLRYIVDDVAAAIPFYVDHLGFTLKMPPAPGFASLTRDGMTLLLNSPGAGGAGASMPDGRKPAPGGWNRFQIECAGLAETVAAMKAKGCVFRSEIIQGNGGRQILVEDPSGNPIELFEPPTRPPS